MSDVQLLLVNLTFASSLSYQCEAHSQQVTNVRHT